MMSPSRSRQAHQGKRNAERRRLAKQANARKTQRHQEVARARHVPASVRRRRHLTAYVLAAMSAVLGVTIFLIYVGTVDVISPNTATVVLGLPAAIIAIAAAITYGD